MLTPVTLADHNAAMRTLARLAFCTLHHTERPAALEARVANHPVSLVSVICGTKFFALDLDFFGEPNEIPSVPQS